MSRTYLVLSLFLIVVLTSNCLRNKTEKINQTIESLKPATDSINNDSVIIIEGQSFKEKVPTPCSKVQTDELKEAFGFLNTNLAYFTTNNIDSSLLMKEEYYSHILKETHFLNFLEDDFKIGQYKFTLVQKNIKEYGKCYIGQFIFKSIVNSAQECSFVIINPKLREITIWNFARLTIDGGLLKCYFEVKGKYSLHKVVYNKDCKLFIPIE